MIYRVAVALGSNLGDRLENLRAAVRGLARLGRLGDVSSLYETAPMGGPEQGPYLNAVVIIETELEPARLLEELHELEQEAGRVRRERWGARTLDLDVITAVDETGRWVRGDHAPLELPHPRAHLRRFVLEPLVEVWPEARLEGDVPARRILSSVEDQEIHKLGSGWTERRSGLARGLFAVQLVLLAGYGVVLVVTGRLPEPSYPLALVGGGIALAGVGVVGWAIFSLGSALSPYPEPRPGAELVTMGPYRLVRHPVYSGIVLFLVGAAAATRSGAGLASAVLIGWFFWVKARYEETRLRLAVPGYAAYQRRVRGRLIPRTKGPT